MDLKKIFPYKILSEDTDQRVDVVLSRKFPNVSRSRWKNLIQKELLFINERALTNASQILKTDDVLDFDQKLSDEAFENIDPRTLLADLPKFRGVEPEIIADDKNFIVISKPVGLAVHPGAGLKFDQTLVCWALNEKLLSHTDSEDSLLKWGDDVVEEFRPGIVHRLDQPTSGLMVLAKNPETHQSLAAQFSAHTASRLYYALVLGQIDRLEKKLPRLVSEFLLKRPCPLALKRDVSGRVSLACFLRRDPVTRTSFQVSPSPEEGKKAISHFAPVGGDGNPYSWVECKLETGRTHQIRVSLKFLDLPIVGDNVYGDVSGTRLFLHAHSLEFDDPRLKKRVSFESAWPKNNKEHLDSLGVRYPELSFFKKSKKKN